MKLKLPKKLQDAIHSVKMPDMKKAKTIAGFVLTGSFLKGKSGLAPARVPDPRVVLEDIRFRAKIPEDMGAKARMAEMEAGEDWGRLLKFTLKNYNTLAFGAVFLVIAMLLLFAGGMDLAVTNYISVLIMLLLVLVIYGQSRVQEKAFDNYIPKIGLIRVTKCAAYSEKLKVSHLVEMGEMASEAAKISYVKVNYNLINTSFAQILVSNASLSLTTAAGKVPAAPDDIVMESVKPSSGRASSVIFTLENPVNFEDIIEAEFTLEGNCAKKVRLHPQLYANVMARKENVQDIFEPWEKFEERLSVFRRASL